MDRLVANPHHSIPCDLDGPLDTLVRSGIPEVERQSALRRLARPWRHGEEAFPFWAYQPDHRAGVAFTGARQLGEVS